MVTLHYGKENIDKEKYIYDTMNTPALVIVPSAYLAVAEKQALSYAEKKAIVGIEFLTLPRLVNKILEDTDKNTQIKIDKHASHILLYKLLTQENITLEAYHGVKDMHAFISLLNDFISELKACNTSPNDIDDLIKKGDLPEHFIKKLRDVSTIYSRYEQSYKEIYSDPIDLMQSAINEIKASGSFVCTEMDTISDSFDARNERSKSNVSKSFEANHAIDTFRDCELWVYEHDSYTAKEISLLLHLSLISKSVNVVVTSPNTNEIIQNTPGFETIQANISTAWESISSDIYETGNRTIENFASIGNENNIEVRKKAIGDYFYNSTLSEDNISIVECANIYNEAETVAAYVSNLIYEKNYRFKDIALVCNDTQSMIPVLNQVFEEYGLNLNIPQSINISSSPISLLIMSFLNILTDGYSTRELMIGLKTNLSTLNSECSDKLENHAIQFNIDGDMWRSPNALEDLRKQAIAPYERLENASLNISTNREFIELFYNFLFNDFNLPIKVQSVLRNNYIKSTAEITSNKIPINSSNNDGRDEIFVINSITSIMENIASYIGDEVYDKNTIRDLFKVGLEGISFPQIPTTIDSINVGSLNSIKTSRIKAIILVGANEGVLPSTKPNSNFFNPMEREYFTVGNNKLCNPGDTAELQEKHALYRVISKATEKIHISYSISDTSGKELRQSELIDSARLLFPQKVVQKDILNRGESYDQISGKINVLRNMSNKMRINADLTPMWRETYNWFLQNDTDSIIKIQDSINFTGKKPLLPTSLVQDLYVKAGRSYYSFSPSRLERHSRCPFSHYILYGLKPEENRIHEIGSREIGDLYHEVLMHFSEYLSNHNIDELPPASFLAEKTNLGEQFAEGIFSPTSSWMKITKEQCYELVDNILSETSKKYRDGLFRKGQEELYRLNRVKGICSIICWIVVLHVRKGAISTIKVEVPFGQGKEIPSIHISLEHQNTHESSTSDATGHVASRPKIIDIHIEGKIDRADYMINDSVKIIDYKTGNTKYSLQEIEKGYSLQLITYLIAAKQLCGNSAGAYYFKIKKPSKSESNDVDSSSKNKSDNFSLPNLSYDDDFLKQYRMDGIIQDENQNIESVDNNIIKKSLVIPVDEKDGEYKASTKNSVVNNLHEIEETVMSHIERISKEIVEGRVDIIPKRIGEEYPCKFCQFIGICKFDKDNYQCNYERL